MPRYPPRSTPGTEVEPKNLVVRATPVLVVVPLFPFAGKPSTPSKTHLFAPWQKVSPCRDFDKRRQQRTPGRFWTRGTWNHFTPLGGMDFSSRPSATLPRPSAILDLFIVFIYIGGNEDDP